MPVRYKLTIYNSENSRVEKFIMSFGTVFQSYKYLNSVGVDYRCYVVSTVDSSNEIVGVLPLVKSSQFKIMSFNLPPYTYANGPIVNYKTDEKLILSMLIDNIKSESNIDFRTVKNEDIFYSENGFISEKNKSHVFLAENIYDKSSLSKGKKRDLNQLLRILGSEEIRIITGKESLELIVDLWQKTSQRSAFNPNIQYLKRILNSGINFYSNVIVDSDGNAIAGAICPFDKSTMYHLVSASKRDAGKIKSNANTLALYTAIKFANENSLNFDFEGSNIEGVSKFYRSMGGQAISVYNYTKTNSLVYKILKFLKKKF